MSTPAHGRPPGFERNEKEQESRPQFDSATAPQGTASTVPGFGPPTAPGEVGTLGAYRVTRLIKCGGMGAVYAAVDTRLGRPVALKVMLPRYADDEQARRRFLREARTAAQVTHDNVVTVHEADECDGVAYIVMPLLDGCSLDDHLKRTAAPDPALAVRVAHETAAGLAAAHQLGLIHRDIKPGNLWLEASGGRVKVLDFGLARQNGTDIELTAPGTVLGTPAYMAPEQARGDKVDHRTDLFSLGTVLYRLCTGRLPFPGANTDAVIDAILTAEPVAIRDLNPAVPKSLAGLIHQLLAKDPDNRPATAEEVVRRVAELADSKGGTTVTHVKRAGARVRRRAGAWAAAGLLATALIAAGVVIIIRSKDGSEKRIDVPDGSVVVIAPGPQTVPPAAAPRSAEAPPEAPQPTEPVVPVAADREAAEYALSVGAWVQVDTKQGDIKAAAELPAGQFALTYVDLSRTKVTDTGLVHFRGCSRIEKINLGGTAVTDAGLVHLKGCRNLLGFGVSGTTVTDAGLAQLPRCPNLRLLFLDSTSVTEKGLAHFAGRPLTWLDLSHTATSDAGLAHFAGCTTMELLYLRDTKITDAGLANFKSCKALRDVQLIGTAVTDAGMVHFAECKDLVYVGLDGTGVTDAGLIHLRGCPHLYNLGLAGTKVTNAGLVHFRDCPKLGELYLNRTAITDIGLSNFKNCKELTVAQLMKTGVTDTGLKQFAGSKALWELLVDDTAVTDAGLAALGDCTGLTKLGAGCPGVTGPGLAHLKGCTALTWLRLNNSGITDAALAHLKTVPRLTNLDVSGTGLTDVGLTHLKECKALKSLGIVGTKVTEQGLAEFHKAKPDCLIEHDGGTIEPKQ